jgi:glycosyltransferase involved in cell wall biosynthesis
MSDDLLVSVVMPVYGRRHLLPIAIQSYLRQSYANRELVVVADGEDMYDLFHGLPNLQYLEIANGRTTVGAKRNLGAYHARGDIICQMDSDDASGPTRIASQVQTLATTKASIVGYHSFPIYDIATARAHRYHYTPAVCCGASLCYRRDWWLTHPFPDQNIAEDAPYTIANREHRVSVDGMDSLVVLLHDENVSTRNQMIAHPDLYPLIPTESLPAWLWERLNAANIHTEISA